MTGETLFRIQRILEAIPGVVRAASLSREQRVRVADLEARHERRLALPVRNLGVRVATARDHCFVILKSEGFRPPKVPTVYMVEDRGAAVAAAAPGDEHELRIAGRTYSVIGEEVVDARRYDEPVIPLEGSFVIFPARRRDPRVPCLFLLPPLPFPELEREAAGLGISDVISTSPSLVSDSFLRETFGFPPTNDLATIIVGFNAPASP